MVSRDVSKLFTEEHWTVISCKHECNESTLGQVCDIYISECTVWNICNK